MIYYHCAQTIKMTKSGKSICAVWVFHFGFMLLLRFRVKMPKSEQTWTGDMVKVIDNMQIVLITCCFIIQSEKQHRTGGKNSHSVHLAWDRKKEWMEN